MTDLNIIKKARPYLRTLMAFIMQVRRPSDSVKCCYGLADLYLEQLEKDIGADLEDEL